MLASTIEAPLQHPDFVYEPKFDGVRTLASVAPGHPKPEVHLYSRQGNEKSAQFPEIVRALSRFALKLRGPVLLDGEIVALGPHGEPVSFQHLQGRIHLKSASRIDPAAPVGFIAFDLLREGPHDLRELSLTARRAALERVFGNPGSPLLRLSPQIAADGRELYRDAIDQNQEGIIAKRASSKYLSGRRSPDWVKLKLQHAQEFVIAGWTSPRGARTHFGSLMLGVYDDKGRLVYVGHVGTGFNDAELGRLMKRLAPLEIPKTPFDVPPPATNDIPHWVRPELVAQVRFTEWTDDGRLRHPAYLGLRDDVDPTAVRREAENTLIAQAHARLRPAAGLTTNAASNAGANTSATNPTRSKPTAKATQIEAGHAGNTAQSDATARVRPAERPARGGAKVRAPKAATPRAVKRPPDKALELVVDQLHDIEKGRKKKGVLVLPDGDTLEVGNLEKVFWPAEKLTKGDLLRYYVRVSPYILPVLQDRALVMKRYPNGVRSEAFYQHRAPDAVPPGVRTETLPHDDVPSRIVGDNLKTLLYVAQLAAISMDPWFSRVQSPDIVDHIAFDLDPMPGVPFSSVLDVARWVRDELAHVGTVGIPKTSGSDGLHIYVPMPPGIPYEIALIWAQIVATMVASKHPAVATIERTVRKRGAKVYVDYLQNIEGKTLASAYSARASEFAGASTPLAWKEIDEGFDRREFTIRTLPARLDAVGDLWAALWTMKPADLLNVERFATKATTTKIAKATKAGRKSR